MNPTKTRIRFGPAGWSYSDWRGVVYPRGMKAHPLDWLQAAFDTVEINTSFYHPMNPAHCREWVDRVAENPMFRFTAKLWSRFTHEPAVEFSEADVALCAAGFDALAAAGRLGCLLIQFPWSFQRTPETRLRLARIMTAFQTCPLTIEFRHASWDCPETRAGLAQRGAAWCNIDQPVLHDCIAPTAYVTAPFAYIRLHGRNTENWFRDGAERNERYNYLYSEGELRPWLERVNQMIPVVDEIYVVANNHYRGQAVVNVLEMQFELTRKKPAVPDCLLDTWPRLRTEMGYPGDLLTPSPAQDS